MDQENSVLVLKSGRSFLLLLFPFLFLALLYGRVMIEGDGLSYYALTYSLVHDHDFDLANQKDEITGVMAPFNTNTNKPASLFSCGFGVLYSPFLWLSEKLPGIENLHPYAQNKHIPFAHAVALFFASSVFSMLALFFTVRFITQKFRISLMNAVAIALTAFIGTPLLFYTFAMPSYSHAADAFLTTAIFVLVFVEPKRAFLRNILLGSTLAMSVMLRNNNIVFVPVAFVALFFQDRKRFARTLLELLAGMLPISAFHLYFNYGQYGKIFATGYRVQTESSFLPEMLFHPWAGLFIWAPITLLGLSGLVLGSIKRRRECLISVVAVALVFCSVQFQPNWWGGCSFGQRFFTHLFFFWAIGLAELAELRPRLTIGAGAAFAFWTFFLFNIFFINAASKQGKEMLSANSCRHSPEDMIRAANVDASTSSWATVWWESLNSGPYPTMQHVLREP